MNKKTLLDNMAKACDKVFGEETPKEEKRYCVKQAIINRNISIYKNQGWKTICEFSTYKEAKRKCIELCGIDYDSEPSIDLGLNVEGFFCTKGNDLWEYMIEAI